MTVVDDAVKAFEEQASEFVQQVAHLPPIERAAALDAEIERLSAHRYLFTADRALAVLRNARARP